MSVFDSSTIKLQLKSLSECSDKLIEIDVVYDVNSPDFERLDRSITNLSRDIAQISRFHCPDRFRGDLVA